MNRLLVTGSRDWTDETLLRSRLTFFADLLDIWAVVHGACPIGADAMADQVARDLGLEVYRFPADWVTKMRKAGPERNQVMVDNGAVLCLAFPLPGSKGTWDCIRRAQAAGIDTLIYEGTRA